MSDAAHTETTTGTPRQHYGLTLAVLVLAALSFALSQTLVTPALPEIQRQLDTSTALVTFVLTGFLLSASVATPLVGRLGDMFGKERMLVITLVIFGVGTLISALSSSIGVLILGRVIQGVAGAVFPLAFGIIRDEFPREKLSTGIGLISATFGFGGGLGLVLSGLIVDHLSYRWLFWLTLAVVAIAIVAIQLWVPESPVKTPARIDWAGALLMTGGLTSMLLAISQANQWGWGSPEVLILLTVAAFFLTTWVRFESRHAHPLVDMRMMRERGVLTTNITAFLVGFGMFGSFILIPQFVQTPVSSGFGFGASVTEAGMFMLPTAGIMLFAGPAAGWFGGRFGSRLPLLAGTAIVSAAFFFLALVHHDRWSIYVASTFLGLGIGFSFASMANLIVAAVDQSKTGVATGMNTIMRTIGGSLGGQVAASIVAGHVVVATGLPDESGFTLAFIVSGLGVSLAFAAAIAIPRRLGMSA